MTTKVPLSIRQNSGSDRHLIGTFLIPPMIDSNTINLFLGLIILRILANLD
ncbi:hypothetical protein [Oceanobacillus massiliensis]|uniref:hypothetical protein n=1 Tax=Oceanobacillus massiliensis TaxID=1465765 RepID=UPI000306D11C|nr:hypothetical protein [Oceanobacillus massiliensis]